jgi:hypothetical protein
MRTAGSAQQDIDIASTMASLSDTGATAAEATAAGSPGVSSSRGGSSGWPAPVFQSFLDSLVKLVKLMPQLKIIELWGLSVQQQQQVTMQSVIVLEHVLFPGQQQLPVLHQLQKCLAG